MKSRVNAMLENWFAIDKILFGTDAKKVLKESEYESYCKTKGVFLSNLYEIYAKVNFNPKRKYSNVIEMANYSISCASQALEKSKKVVMSEIAKDGLVNEIKQVGLREGLDPGMVKNYVIGKRIKSTAIDTVTLVEALTACGLDKSDITIATMIDVHKIMRDNLIEFAHKTKF